MSATRIVQSHPLKSLASLPRQCLRQRRNLHMTGPATYAPSALATDALAADLTSSTSSVAINPTAHRRATRQFNTTRTLKVTNDTPTIDFAYFPSSDSPAPTTDAELQSLLLRVPIIHQSMTASPARATEGDYEVPVMKPEISSSSLDSIVLPIAEVSDNNAVHVDFAAFANAIQGAGEVVRGVVVEPVVEVAQQGGGKGAVGKLWEGLVEDVLGKKQGRIA